MESAAMATSPCSAISPASLSPAPLLPVRLAVRPRRTHALLHPASRPLVARCSVTGDKVEAETPIEKSWCFNFGSLSLSLCVVVSLAIIILVICLDHYTHVIPVPGFPAFPTVMDINQIRNILPHRYPFLLVDRMIDYKPGEYAVAIKNVSINDDFFQGHFPDRPIMPGVFMVEAMAQVGGIVMLQPEVGGSRENFFFAGIDKVRFRKPVVPGDTLIMRMTLIKLQKRFGIAKMEGKDYVGSDLVCEGEFLMATGSE